MSESLPENRFRFSLGDALGVTALLAIVTAPISWLGGSYVVQATVSMVFLGWAALCLYQRWAVPFVVCCPLALLLAAVTFSSAIFLQVVCTVFVLLITMPFRRRVRMRVAACAFVMIAAYGPMLTNAAASDRRVARLRAAWPLISIRERLSRVSNMPRSPQRLSPEQELGVEAVEQVARGHSRGGLPRMLQRLHGENYERFARTPGFGFMRMGPVTEFALEREANDLRIERVTLPATIGTPRGGMEGQRLHRRVAGQFVSDERLGFVRSPDEVAGFLGHGVSELPFVDKHSETAWRLQRLDLIGLMRDDAPVAYVSQSLPDMEQLRDGPTRRPNEFERGALAQIQGDRELVVERDGDRRLRMLGALRAGESCAACHAVARGTLLGAFSYELAQLQKAVANPPAQSPPAAGG